MADPDIMLSYLRNADAKLDRIIADIADMKAAMIRIANSMAKAKRELERAEKRLEQVEKSLR